MSLRRRRPGLVYPVNEDWHYVGEAGEPAFANSWVNYASGSPALAFRVRETGILDIQGVVGSGVAGTIFTLPVGYRPTSVVNIPITGFSSSGSHVAAVLIVAADGAVQYAREVSSTPVYDAPAIVYAQVFLSPPVTAGSL